MIGTVIYMSKGRYNLNGTAIGGEGEGEEGRQGDREEGVDEEDVLAAEGLGPGAGVDADELLDGEVEGDLLGLVEEENSVGRGGGPGGHGVCDEAVDVGEQHAVADGGGGGEAGEGEGVEALVAQAAHEQQGVAAEQRADGGGVAALDGAALAVEHGPVEVGVGGEDGALPEDVRGEEAPEAPHALPDEGLGVVRLVGGDELERLPDERQPHAARRHGHRRGASSAGQRKQEKEKSQGRRQRSREEQGEGLPAIQIPIHAALPCLAFPTDGVTGG